MVRSKWNVARRSPLDTGRMGFNFYRIEDVNTPPPVFKKKNERASMVRESTILVGGDGEKKSRRGGCSRLESDPSSSSSV